MGIGNNQNRRYEDTSTSNDLVPWPNVPHGHIYDMGAVIDDLGNIYKAHTSNKPELLGRLSKKDKKEWDKFLKNTCK